MSGVCGAAVAALGYFLLLLLYVRRQKTPCKLFWGFCHSQLNLLLADTLNLTYHLQDSLFTFYLIFSFYLACQELRDYLFLLLLLGAFLNSVS